MRSDLLLRRCLARSPDLLRSTSGGMLTYPRVTVTSPCCPYSSGTPDPRTEARLTRRLLPVTGIGHRASKYRDSHADWPGDRAGGGRPGSRRLRLRSALSAGCLVPGDRAAGGIHPDHQRCFLPARQRWPCPQLPGPPRSRPATPHVTRERNSQRQLLSERSWGGQMSSAPALRRRAGRGL
jgi:hypothetical protein